MAQFLSENWGNIVVVAVLVAAVAGILVNMHRRKKAGKGCGCGCGDCPSKGICHPGTFSREKK